METPKGKCHLIVDGSYVHKVCIRLGAEFDFALLVKWLEAMLGVECDTRVFVDFIPDPSKPFYCQLRKYGFECVSCEMKTETKYDPVQQKEFSCRVQMGADVQIALFMTLWAHDEKCSHIAVLTGDGDFFPVFAYIKNHTNKDLRLLCFNGAAHECLLPHCTRTFIDELDSVLVARPGTVIRPLVSVRQRTLYVGNMPDGFPTEENIHELFKDYGEIDSIRLALIQGRSYIYARVTFSDHASAGRALLALNGHLVGESKRPLRIEWDAARKKRAPAPTASSSGILVGERSSPVSSDTSPVMSPSSATMRCDAPPSLQLGAPEFVPRARAAPTPPCAVEFHPVAAQALPYVPMPIAVQVPPPPVAAQAPPCVPPPSPFVSVESPPSEAVEDVRTTSAIYVSNLPFPALPRSASKDEKDKAKRELASHMEELFNEFGPITSANAFTAMRGRTSTAVRVSFLTRTSAKAAIAAMDGHVWKERTLGVTWFGANRPPGGEVAAPEANATPSCSAEQPPVVPEPGVSERVEALADSLFARHFHDDAEMCRWAAREAGGDEMKAVEKLFALPEQTRRP